MISEPSLSSPAVWVPPALLSAVTGLLLLGGDTALHWLRYDRAAVAAGEWWRLLSGNLVHLGWWHWFFNVLSLVLLVLLCPERLAALEWLRRLLVLGLGMSLGLYFLSPGVQTYVGLSGLIYGLFVLGLGRQALRRDEIAMVCLAFLAVRIGWELVEGASAAETRLLGGQVVAISHLYGVLSALLYGLAAWGWGKVSGLQRGGSAA
jgi:rhomboid family GlyGly-CTERM serine protease